jgi:hypothetical protein
MARDARATSRTHTTRPLGDHHDVHHSERYHAPWALDVRISFGYSLAVDDIFELITLLAQRTRSGEYDGPALDLGPDRSRAIPFPALPWTERAAAIEGERVIARIDKWAPASVLRALRAYGPVQLHENAIEMAVGMHWPHVPLDQIYNLEPYDGQSTPGQVLFVGDRLANCVVVRARWDDPQVIGCADLSRGDEPLWLLYTPDTLGSEDHLMPLGLSYEDVLRAHLTGVDLILTLPSDAFDRALARMGRLDREFVPSVGGVFDTIDSLARTFSERSDVDMRNMEVPDYRAARLDEGSAWARSRIQRMREVLSHP